MYFPSFSTAVSALPMLGFFSGPKDHAWKRPGPNDLRGPCPGLNVLANHGYLPRDGKGLTIPMVMEAASAIYNISPEILTLPTHLALLTSGKADTFTLDDLKLHNTIEHDASLSRSDYAVTGDNVHFNSAIFETLARSNPTFPYYDVTSAAHVMHQRLEHSRRVNPAIINTQKELTIRLGESLLYLTVMGDNTGVALKQYVNVFFREERLPYAEGWKTPTTTLSPALAGQIQGALAELVIPRWRPGPGNIDPSIVIVVDETGRNVTF
ncbi:Cloroperoxidase [Mycena floridula]|nr:Cloroperoxidase [Mycena floridula]